MKSFKLLLLFVSIALATSAQFGMPSMREVANYFFEHYTYDDQAGWLRFQRKKQGWYVSLEQYENQGQYVRTALLWSREHHRFLDIGYAAAKEDTTGLSATVEKFFRSIQWDFDEYGFGRTLYYGYTGWDWDIINEPMNTATASDTLLESMARAYSSYASGFVTDQFGNHFINNDSDRALLKDTDKISKSRLDKLIRYDLESIRYYKKLQARNPNYTTKVGNIALKTANEYMFLSFWLKLAGDTVRARKYAKEAVYPDSILKLSKLYLQDLPKNSILVTGGDNDSYPLWYLQDIANYRRDILVVNYSLLALRRQLLYYDRKYPRRLFTTKDSLYLQKSMDYSFYNNKNEKDEPLELEAFLEDLRGNRNPFFDAQQFHGVGEGIRTYYSKTLYLNLPDLLPSKALQLNDYLLLNDFMLLDMIQTNSHQRFYSTFNIDVLAPLLQFNGVVFELVE